jgi:glycosyltransferase involved in cell wall biosynthesis
VSRALRVALAHPVYWPEVRRGAERLLRELADGLAARGHRPRIVTSHPGPRERTVEDGIEVVRARRPPARPLDRLGVEPHVLQAPGTLRELLAGEDDVVEALQAGDALAAAAWARRRGRPAVFSLMGIPDEATLAGRRGRAALVRTAARRCAAVTVLSEAAAAACRRTLAVEPRVIAPGVDLGAFALGTARTPEPTVVCAAAAGEPRKRVGLLVEAFGRVRREHPGARLVLDARGSERFAGVPGVERAAMDDRAALAALLGAAWVAALPAVGEAFGLVLAEALACGTPVVGARDGGIPEVVGDAGRLFDGDDPAALAGALLEGIAAARTGGDGLRAACRAQAERFSTARCAAAHEALYSELLAAAGR